MKNNALENKKRVNHEHEVGDYAQILHRKNSRMRPTKLSQPSEVKYEIVEVLEKTVKIQCGAVREEISINRTLLQQGTRMISVIVLKIFTKG